MGYVNTEVKGQQTQAPSVGRHLTIKCVRKGGTLCPFPALSSREVMEPHLEASEKKIRDLPLYIILGNPHLHASVYTVIDPFLPVLEGMSSFPSLFK